MNNFTLNREETVLFVVDIQEKLVPAMKEKDKVVKNNNILITAAKEMNFPIVATEQYPKGLGRTIPELLPLIGEENIFAKNSFTAYTQDVKEKLEFLGRKKILITGMETHICIFQTVRDLIKDGYQVYLAKDAICSRDEENYQNGLDLCKSLGSVITNTETAVYDLLKVSGTPEFKTILKLIK